jgi:hypothetical protein
LVAHRFGWGSSINTPVEPGAGGLCSLQQLTDFIDALFK